MQSYQKVEERNKAKPSKLQTEGTLYATLLFQTSRQNGYFLPPLQFIYILYIIYIQFIYILYSLYTYIFLFQRFASNQSFLCNYHQSIKIYKIRGICCEGPKSFLSQVRKWFLRQIFKSSEEMVLKKYVIFLKFYQQLILKLYQGKLEPYSEPCEAFPKEHFAKILNCFQV